MTNYEISMKLQQIRPLAQWVLSGNTYDGLVLLDQVQVKPTAQELGL